MCLQKYGSPFSPNLFGYNFALIDFNVLSSGISFFENKQLKTLLHGQYIYYMLTYKLNRLSYIYMQNRNILILTTGQCFSLSNFKKFVSSISRVVPE